jgi:membrane-associated phospholipid phosphatase
MKLRSLRSAVPSVVAAVLLGALGCAQLPADTGGASVAPSTLRATATQHWNEYARDLVTRNPSAPSPRVFAYLALAQRNAAVVARQTGRDVDGAVAGASAAVLALFIPNDAQVIEGNLVREEGSLGANGTRRDFAAGVEIGKRVAQDVIAAAKTDRFDAVAIAAAPTAPGAWTSQARPPAPPLYRQFPGMRPFYLASASEFRAPPPAALGSDAFRATLAEVRKTSDHRTTEQLRIAQRWEMVTGPYMPGFWNQIALDAAEAHHFSQAETAELLALVHMAWLDAFIACADSKYVYWVPRPSQLDPEIRLAIGLPNHPSYPSNHSCTASASGGVLDGLFPDERGRYSALAREIAISRLYAGIHYRIDLDAGLEIGRNVAAKVLAQRLPPDRVWLPSSQ